MVSNGAARQRLYLERRKNDLRVLPALVLETRITELLLKLGFLTIDDPTRQQLADAFSRWAFDRMTRQEQELWPDL